MKILLLDNYDSFTYNLAQIIEESCDFDFDIVKNDEISLRKVANYDKILLSPGPDIPSKAGLMNEIIDKFAKEKSIFGVCLGMQAIAEVFGGTLRNMPKVMHGKKAEIFIQKDDYIYKNVKNPFQGGLYHSWCIDKIPDDLEITAISSEKIIMSISHKKFDVKGVQFHPESYMTTEGRKILSNWLNNVF